MNKKRIIEALDTFFSIDDEHNRSELESFEKSHSLISIGFIVLFTVTAFLFALFLNSIGMDIEFDHIKNYK